MFQIQISQCQIGFQLVFCVFIIDNNNNVPSHPHTGPGDIATLALQTAQDLNDVLNVVSPNLVHCEPSYERSFELT